jgi:hypothetical protein
MVGN